MKKINSLLVLVIIFSFLVMPFAGYAATVPGTGDDEDIEGGGGGGGCVPESNIEVRGYGHCEDSKDNDCDGFTDCQDPDCECTTCTEPSNKCNDGYDNDCNGEADYDFSTGTHGDIKCPVGVEIITVTESSYSPGDTIHVQCVSTVSGVDSIDAYAGSTKCQWDSENAWSGDKTFFICSIPLDVSSELTVKCKVNTAKSYAKSGYEQRTKTIQRESDYCSSLITEFKCGSASGCQWISNYCSGNKYYSPADPNGICISSETIARYTCKKGECGAECDATLGGCSASNYCSGDSLIKYTSQPSCRSDCTCGSGTTTTTNCNANNNGYCEDAQCRTSMNIDTKSCIRKTGLESDEYEYGGTFKSNLGSGRTVQIKESCGSSFQHGSCTTDANGNCEFTFRCPGKSPGTEVTLKACVGTTEYGESTITVSPCSSGDCGTGYYCDDDGICREGQEPCPHTCGTADRCDTTYSNYDCQNAGDVCYKDGGNPGTNSTKADCCATPTTQTACTQFNADECCPTEFKDTSGSKYTCEVVGGVSGGICKPTGEKESATGKSYTKKPNEKFKPCVTTTFGYEFASTNTPQIGGTCSFNGKTCDLILNEKEYIFPDKIKLCCADKSFTAPSQPGTYKYTCSLDYK